MQKQRTQVGIIGAGPSGLTLAQLLHGAGIESVVLERRSRDYVLGRVRAGVIEQGTVEILRKAGVAARLEREGLKHHGVEIAGGDRRYRIDFSAHERESHRLRPDGAHERPHGCARWRAACRRCSKSRTSSSKTSRANDRCVRFAQGGATHELDCDFIAGCDGFHGVSRKAIPARVLKTHERVYPFGWLGVLADVPPVSPELVYASHERGFALCSMRSAARSRCYVQCDLDTNSSDWSDERFWDELATRLPAELAARVTRAPTIEKSVAPLRSFVAEPLRYGRLFLAGDAAHIVPPTGAKGLNLAVRDVDQLAAALVAHYAEPRRDLLDAYSAAALRRIWRAERFSAWLTSVLHRFPGQTSFDRGMQLAELDHLVSSAAARTAFVEAYTGL